MPNGSSGLDPGAWMAQWVTQGTGLSALAGRTQDAISQHYQDQALASPSWQQAANNFFQNILGGFGNLGQFLELVVEAVTGTPGALTALQSFMTAQWGTLADSLQWLTDIGVLVDTFFKFLAGTKTQADLDAAWVAVCSDFGVTSPNWTTFWDSIFAQYVTPTGTFSPAAWSKRLTNDLTILFDVFHVTYEAGSPSDAPGHLGTNGKATWYSAWNDLLSLVGIVNSTTAPTVTAPDIAGKVSTAQSTAQGSLDAVNQGVIPNASTGASAAAVNSTVASLQQNVNGLQSQIVNLQSSVAGPTTVLRDNGQDSPGTGLGSNWTSTQATTVNRNSSYGFVWQASGGSPRTEVGIYNTPLATNDQVGTIVLNGLMTYWPADFYGGSVYQDGAPENWIILRADSPTSPNNFIFARVRYNDVQFGYCHTGTITLLGSPTTCRASASASYSFYAGDASSDYNFKIVSGGRTVATYVDSAHATAFCVSNRYSGQAWKSDTDPGHSGSEAVPASTSWAAYDAVASAGAPIGYGYINRLSLTQVTMTSGVLPFTFFDNTVALGSGIVLPTSGPAGLKVLNSGLYAVSWGLREYQTPNATDVVPGISVNGSLVETGPTFMYDGGGIMLNGGQYGMASAGIICQSGDVISPSQWGYSGVHSGSELTGGGGSAWCGESTGVRSFLKIAKIG